jgi:hypothetical protein
MPKGSGKSYSEGRKKHKKRSDAGSSRNKTNTTSKSEKMSLNERRVRLHESESLAKNFRNWASPTAAVLREIRGIPRSILYVQEILGKRIPPVAAAPIPIPTPPTDVELLRAKGRIFRDLTSGVRNVTSTSKQGYDVISKVKTDPGRLARLQHIVKTGPVMDSEKITNLKLRNLVLQKKLKIRDIY